MKTDVITISNKGAQMETALNQVDKVCAYKGLTGNNALHLRLLAEEMMGMMRSITGETEGEFWIEDEKNVYQLHLKVNTAMNADKQEQLLSVASSGKNEAKLGLMDRIRDFFSVGSELAAMPGCSPLLLPEMFEGTSTPVLDWEWSMMEYHDALYSRVQREEAEAIEAWDELEKSVVAHVADEIKVAIRGGSVEMTIIKKMA